MGTEMDVGQYLVAVRRHWMLVTVLVLVCAVAAAAFALTRPSTSTAQSQLFVSTTAAPGNVSQTYEGGLFAQQRVLSYVSIITSPFVIQRVISQLGLQESVQQIQGEVQATVPTGTVLIDVTVNDRSQSRAKALADAVDTQFIRFVEALETPRSGQRPNVTVSMSSPARIVSGASTRRTFVYLALGILVGLVLGLGAAVVRDSTDDRIRGGEDVPGPARPVLGNILEDPGAGTRPLVALEDPNSVNAEAYRRTRTNLQGRLQDRGPRSILVSSAMPSEGKTLVAANLGVAFAQAGYRVAMVDADLRRPRLGAVFGASSTRGLTDLLKENVALEWVLREHSTLSLELLDAGPLPTDPSEMLQSGRFREVMDLLAARADIVIVDSPPLLPVTDAAMVAPHVTGVVLVARAAYTRVAELRTAVQSLGMVHAPVLGVVLNRVSPQDAQRYARTGADSSWVPESRPPPADQLASARTDGSTE